MHLHEAKVDFNYVQLKITENGTEGLVTGLVVAQTVALNNRPRLRCFLFVLVNFDKGGNHEPDLCDKDQFSQAIC